MPVLMLLIIPLRILAVELFALRPPVNPVIPLFPLFPSLTVATAGLVRVVPAFSVAVL